MTDDPHTTETTAAPGTEVSTVGAHSTAPEVQAPSQPSLSGLTSPTPAPPQPTVRPDIANILKGIRLPEQPRQKTPTPIAGQAPALGVLPRFEPSPSATPVEHAMTGVAVPTAGSAQNFTASDVPNAPTVAPATASASEQPQEGMASSINSLHTMKGDLQGIVRNRKISLVRAAALEQDRNTRRTLVPTMPTLSSGGGRRVGLMLTAALLFLGLGGTALYFAYTLTNGSSLLQRPITSGSVLFAEDQTAFPLDDRSPSSLKQALGGMFSGAGAVGSITQVIPTVSAPGTQTSQRPATLQEFFTELGIHSPDDLLRALSNDFFLGIHMADVPAPVFIIPVISYDRAFAGMLAWEPSIDADLAPLFRQVPRITASPTGGVPVERTFKDLVVRNYDVRGLADDSGAIVLYYSFPTPEILIIAASPYTFPEVLSRLQAERKL